MAFDEVAGSREDAVKLSALGRPTYFRQGPAVFAIDPVELFGYFISSKKNSSLDPISLEDSST